MNSEFYTYLWLREDGTPYYVGKGKNKRGLRSQGHWVSCPEGPRIIVQHHSSEHEAFAAEEFLISFYKRKCDGGCLLNIAPGASKKVLTSDWDWGKIQVVIEEYLSANPDIFDIDLLAKMLQKEFHLTQGEAVDAIIMFKGDGFEDHPMDTYRRMVAYA